MVARKNGKSYPGNGKSLRQHISYIYGNTCPGGDMHCIYWSVAKSSHEQNKVTSYMKNYTSSKRFDAIKYMLNELTTNYYSGNPIIVITGIKNGNWSYNNNDINATNSYNQQNWITSNSNNAHFITIVAVDWKQGGSGSIVYYYDPISPNSNLQKCSLTRLLDAMPSSPQSRYYNFLSLW